MKGARRKVLQRWMLQSGGRALSRRLLEESYGQLWDWNNSCVECGNDSPFKKAWARSISEAAETVTRLGTGGRWQHETPYKEELEHLRHRTDLRFGGLPMRQAYNAGKSGDWANVLETFVENGKFSVCTSVQVREGYNEVEQEGEDRQSIVQDILQKTGHGKKQCNWCAAFLANQQKTVTAQSRW